MNTRDAMQDRINARKTMYYLEALTMSSICCRLRGKEQKLPEMGIHFDKLSIFIQTTVVTLLFQYLSL
jgi:hypothetical protein